MHRLALRREDQSPLDGPAFPAGRESLPYAQSELNPALAAALVDARLRTGLSCACHGSLQGPQDTETSPGVYVNV